MAQQGIVGKPVEGGHHTARRPGLVRRLLWNLRDALLDDRAVNRMSAHQLRDIGLSESHPHRRFRDLL
jgi:uncharacterized protein YjiS (DUF1127 family)